MLYECWRDIAARHAGEMALLDLPSGRRWSFSELSAAGEAFHDSAGSRFAFPSGASMEFILTVLAAWREGRIVCPLEAGQASPRFDFNPPQGCAHLKMTSATTGAARVIAFNGAQLAADVENITATMGLRPDRPNLAVVSLAHSYGFSNLVLPLLLRGIPLVLGHSPLPETLRRGAAVVEHLTVPGVPALWRAWNDANAIPANVTLAISAGAPLPPNLDAEIFARTGLKVHNFYGSSECGGIAFDRSPEPRSDGSHVGEPMRNVEVSIGTSGCVEVRSAAVGMGYLPEPDGRLADGRFQTTDLGELKDGRLFLRGRAGEQINVAGRKVSPEWIERALAAHPRVRECLVFGVPSISPERGEDIVACVVTAEGAEAGPLLKSFLADHLQPWQMPREWWFVGSLQVNARGKLSRAEWRGRFLAEMRSGVRI
jgi:acyl-CoA synthetase (AMP-forming)/AMP-acid ligase II